MTDPIGPGSGTPRPRRRGRLLPLVIGALLLLYIAWPYFSLWRFTAAVRAGDANELEARVDFESLRKSVKEQLRAKIAASRENQPGQPKKSDRFFGALSSDFGPRLVDTLVDAYLTPEGLAAFLANPELPQVGQAQAPVSPAAPGAAAPAPPVESSAMAPAPPPEQPKIATTIDWSRVRYAFFTGPRDFMVDIEGTKLRFRLGAAGWQLNAIELDLSELKL